MKNGEVAYGTTQEEKTAALTAERDKYRTVLEKMASQGCGKVYVWPNADGIGQDILWCGGRWPDKRDNWCWLCIARHTLNPENRDGET